MLFDFFFFKDWVFSMSWHWVVPLFIYTSTLILTQTPWLLCDRWGNQEPNITVVTVWDGTQAACHSTLSLNHLTMCLTPKLRAHSDRLVRFSELMDIHSLFMEPLAGQTAQRSEIIGNIVQVFLGLPLPFCHRSSQKTPWSRGSISLLNFIALSLVAIGVDSLCWMSVCHLIL